MSQSCSCVGSHDDHVTHIRESQTPVAGLIHWWAIPADIGCMPSWLAEAGVTVIVWLLPPACSGIATIKPALRVKCRLHVQHVRHWEPLVLVAER
jgi:hypothetical protein